VSHPIYHINSHIILYYIVSHYIILYYIISYYIVLYYIILYYVYIYIYLLSISIKSPLQDQPLVIDQRLIWVSGAGHSTQHWHCKLHLEKSMISMSGFGGIWCDGGKMNHLIILTYCRLYVVYHISYVVIYRYIIYHQTWSNQQNTFPKKHPSSCSFSGIQCWNGSRGCKNQINHEYYNVGVSTMFGHSHNSTYVWLLVDPPASEKH